MRIGMASLAGAALVLAGCGGAEEEAADGAAMSPEQAAEAMEDVVEARPGQYETRVQLVDIAMPDVPGVGEAQMAQMREMLAGSTNTTSTFCLTPEEAAQGPQRMVREMAEADCTFERFDVSGGDLSARMQCRNPQGLQGTYTLEGEMTPESSDMRMQIVQAMPGVAGGGQMEMDMRVTSRRVGECT